MEEKKPIKLVSFDFDGTLVADNSWKAFNAACGMTPEDDKKYHDAYFNSQITYDGWVDVLISIWKKCGTVTREQGKKVAEGFRIHEGAQEIVAYLKDKGYRVIVTTGGVDLVVGPVLEKIGIDEAVYTTESVFENETFVRIINHGSASEIAEASAFKLAVFNSFLKQEGIVPEECAHIGDGVNDKGIWNTVGLPIFYGTETLGEGYPTKRITKLEELKKFL